MTGPTSIGTGVGRLIGVFDTRQAAEAARTALAGAGFDTHHVELLHGEHDAERFDVSGRRRGLVGRLYRIVEFMWADQAPDFAWYAAALRQGWTVLAIRARGDARIRAAAAILAEHGGHFVNHFGWFETQEISRWRGREPELPSFLRR